jgi:histidine ammonia-lyase
MFRTKANEVLREAISAVDARVVPPRLVEKSDQISNAYDGFIAFLIQNVDAKIYGVNKLPGHKELEQLPSDYMSEFQHDLIINHKLPATHYFPSEVGIYVSLAKFYHFATGTSTITSNLYERLILSIQDKDFLPNIPENMSYSSGDVIPGAHWAHQFLARHPDYHLCLGEGMALINGSFVHTGTLIWAFRKAAETWAKIITVSKLFFCISPPFEDSRFSGSIVCSPFDAVMNFLHQESTVATDRVSQGPVSIRATRQILEALAGTLEELSEELAKSLSTPSGNPLIFAQSDGAFKTTPSGIFVNPALSLATGKLLDAFLMVGWYIERRISFILTGQISGIPKDYSTKDNPLGLIQWPKLALAKLETMRSIYSVREFSSGGSTSEGIEDFWTNGTQGAIRLFRMCKDIQELIEIEYTILININNNSSAIFKMESINSEKLNEIPKEISFI